MKAALIVLALFFVSLNFEIPKKWKKHFSFVSSGLALVDGDSTSVQSFYMLNHEVTNQEYTDFLAWLETNGSKEDRAAAAIRNDNWINEMKYPSDGYAKHYHTHKAYKDYPVVNITHQGALLYCSWLEHKLNKSLTSEYNVKVRLPHHVEFIKAGAAEVLNANYSWKDNFMRNTDGTFRANFVYIPQSQITRDSTGALVTKPFDRLLDENQSVDLTAPSKSFRASKEGFYNLNGNVAEMINEPQVAVGGSWMDYGYDIRLQSRKTYDESSCLVGFRPVFTVVK